MQAIVQILFIILITYFFAFLLRLFLSVFKFGQNSFTALLCKITDPVIDYFKLKFPLKVGPFEISSIIPVILMYFMLKFLSDITNGYSIIDINYLLYIVFYAVKISYVVFLTAAIISVALIVLSNNSLFSFNSSLTNYARSKLQPVMIFMRKNIKFQFLSTDNRYYILLLIFLILALIFGSMILQYFVFIFEAKVSGRITKIKT